MKSSLIAITLLLPTLANPASRKTRRVFFNAMLVWKPPPSWPRSIQA